MAAAKNVPLIVDPLDALAAEQDGGDIASINTDEIPDLTPREARVVGASLIEDVQPTTARVVLPEEDLSKYPARWTRERVIAVLAAYPKVQVYIPKEPWEAQDPNACQFVGYQGWGFLIPKGMTKAVPAPLAEIVYQSQEALTTEQARNQSHFLIPLRGDEDFGREIVVR